MSIHDVSARHVLMKSSWHRCASPNVMFWEAGAHPEPCGWLADAAMLRALYILLAQQFSPRASMLPVLHGAKQPAPAS